MKLATKPLSSPGRTEKFPPPLMRFLRSNVGSKSRGRSRSSPMFVRRKSSRNNNTSRSTAIETQEPSSPKVTCMGQVRVKRSKQGASKNKHEQARPPSRTLSAPKGCCSKWIQNAFLCCTCSCTCKAKSRKCFATSWRKLRLCFQLGCQRKVQTREDSSRFESKCGSQSEVLEQENEDDIADDDESVHETKVFSSSMSSPPKNALLLMRSRSAPYRSSSLASQFWGPQEEEEQKKNEEHEATEKPTTEKESTSKDSDEESEKKLEVIKEFEGSIKERFVKSANVEESNAIRPLILTRCKSEPARIAGRLDPEIGFWMKKRRLAFAADDSSSPHDL